jgi:imidazolonepropionase-like amidohydrolase
MIPSRTLFPALALGLLAAPAIAQDGAVAVRAGKVVTAPGQVIEQGTVIVQNGRIVAVGGPDLEIPFDVLLHEFDQNTVLFAGFAEAHTSNGMDRPNENVPVAPFLDVSDSIDPVSFYFENELREGVTAMGVIPGNNTVIGGMGRVVAPHGMTVEQMSLGDGMGMKIAIGPRFGWSRSAQLAELREAEDALNDSLRRLGQQLLDGEAAEADAAKAGDEAKEKSGDGDAHDDAGGFVRYGDDFPGKALISEEDLDDVQRGMVHILNGDVRLWLSCPTATDVAHGLRWASERGLENVVYVVSADAHKAADLLAEAGAHVALIGGLEAVELDPVSGEEKRTFAPTIFAEKGITFSIGSEQGRMGPDRLGYQAALCVREGMSRADAMALVTTNPAKLWGMEGQVGSLQEGALGNFTLMSGDPLAADSQVLHVWVRGNHVYDRAKDERLQRLLEGRNQ